MFIMFHTMKNYFPYSANLFFRVFAISSILAIASCATKPKGPVAYVTNERDGTIVVIDTLTDRAVSTIKVGARPRGIQLESTQNAYINSPSLLPLSTVENLAGRYRSRF